MYSGSSQSYFTILFSTLHKTANSQVQSQCRHLNNQDLNSILNAEKFRFNKRLLKLTYHKCYSNLFKIGSQMLLKTNLQTLFNNSYSKIKLARNCYSKII